MDPDQSIHESIHISKMEPLFSTTWETIQQKSASERICHLPNRGTMPLPDTVVIAGISLFGVDI